MTSNNVISAYSCHDNYPFLMLQLDTCSFSTRDENSEFANSVDHDEVAHDEPPHLDLYCLPSSLRILNM